jgi:hypothetical protein
MRRDMSSGTRPRTVMRYTPLDEFFDAFFFSRDRLEATLAIGTVLLLGCCFDPCDIARRA